MELDLKDKKILLELDLDSRQSFKQLGKKVGLSKEVIAYRIGRLVKDGVIRHFYTRIDTSKLGILLFRTFLKLYNLSPKIMEEIIQYIAGEKRIGWCVLVDGTWDVNFIYWAESVAEFGKFWHKFLEKFGENIQDKWISIANYYIELPKTFLTEKKRSPELAGFLCGLSEKQEIEKEELEILKILASNSRTPTLELAEKVGLSPKSVTKKIKELEKKKIIGGYGININLGVIGWEYYKLHMNFKKFDEKLYNQFIEYCKQNSNISHINEVIGGGDMELDIYIKNNAEYHKLLDEIKYKFSEIIKNTETLQYYKALKYNLFPR